MDGFTKLPKMQHFKEGGGVKNAYCGGGKAYKKGGEVHDKVEEKEDKKLIKKAFAMHDKQEHEGEKTDLSKLRKGGRAKKETGTVRKFKVGGPVGMKKDEKDIKEIAEVKKTKAQKLCGGGKAGKYAEGGNVQEMLKQARNIKDLDPGIYAKPSKTIKTPFGDIDAEKNDQGIYVKPKRTIKTPLGDIDAEKIDQGIYAKSGFKKGGRIKKAEGGAIEDAGKAGLGNVPKPNLIDSAKDTVNRIGKRLYENVVGTPEQNAAAQARLDRYEASKKGTPVTKKRGGKC